MSVILCSYIFLVVLIVSKSFSVNKSPLVFQPGKFNCTFSFLNILMIKASGSFNCKYEP